MMAQYGKVVRWCIGHTELQLSMLATRIIEMHILYIGLFCMQMYFYLA